MTPAAVKPASPVVHPRDGRPAPAWAVRVAHLIPLAVLPSGLWRIALVAGVPLGAYEHGAPARTHGWESVYVLSLSVVSEALALLSLGLVRPWGEVFPRWLPLLGGRRLPPSFAVTVATAGAIGATLVWGYATWGVLVRDLAVESDGLGFSPAGFALLVACYVPLLLWGPLLLALTIAYRRRRCRD